MNTLSNRTQALHLEKNSLEKMFMKPNFDVMSGVDREKMFDSWYFSIIELLSEFLEMWLKSQKLHRKNFYYSIWNQTRPTFATGISIYQSSLFSFIPQDKFRTKSNLWYNISENFLTILWICIKGWRVKAKAGNI